MDLLLSGPTGRQSTDNHEQPIPPGPFVIASDLHSDTAAGRTCYM
jgi:hypothetical protein